MRCCGTTAWLPESHPARGPAARRNRLVSGGVARQAVPPDFFRIDAMPRLVTRIAACAAIIGVVLWFQPRINEPAAQVSNGLNLRSAPDARAERLAVLPVGTTVEVQRCLDDLQWCNVRAGGKSGWVAADYLIARSDGKRVRLAEAGKELGVVIETARPGG
jgi:hypothetical protein